ncbi:MAG: hypothetical protein ACK58N_01360 [Synechocystis sp.]|jgi:chromosome segregation ATPase
MSKKSLSDLLREEAKDPQMSPSEVSAVSEASPVESPNPQVNTSAELSQLQAQLSQAQAQVDTLKATLQQEKSLGEDLKKQLGDCQKQDQKQVKTLETAQQTIKTLEQNLKQEQSKVKTLQKELQAIAQLQTELEAEKTLVGKLYGKIQDLENSLAATPAPSSASTSSTLALRPPAMPSRYIAPAQPPSNLTDEDIGWFD